MKRVQTQRLEADKDGESSSALMFVVARIFIFLASGYRQHRTVSA